MTRTSARSWKASPTGKRGSSTPPTISPAAKPNSVPANELTSSLCRTPRAVAASFGRPQPDVCFPLLLKVSMASLRSLFALLLCAAVGSAAELHTLANKHLTGDLVSVSDKEIVLRIATSEVKTPVGEVLQIDLQRDAPLASGTKYADIELIDGSLLHCTKFTIKGKDIEVALAGSDLKAKVPLAAVSYILNDAHATA